MSADHLVHHHEPDRGAHRQQALARRPQEI
jgi:hypothetical protein